MRLLGAAIGLLIAACAVRAQDSTELATPIKICAQGKPIDLLRAAPFVCNLTGEGVRHLLLGEPGEGRLRIYRNLGTENDPQFGDFVCLREGQEDGRIPAS